MNRGQQRPGPPPLSTLLHTPSCLSPSKATRNRRPSSGQLYLGNTHTHKARSALNKSATHTLSLGLEHRYTQGHSKNQDLSRWHGLNPLIHIRFHISNKIIPSFHSCPPPPIMENKPMCFRYLPVYCSVNLNVDNRTKQLSDTVELSGSGQRHIFHH